MLGSYATEDSDRDLDLTLTGPYLQGSSPDSDPADAVSCRGRAQLIRKSSSQQFTFSDSILHPYRGTIIGPAHPAGPPTLRDRPHATAPLLPVTGSQPRLLMSSRSPDPTLTLRSAAPDYTSALSGRPPERSASSQGHSGVFVKCSALPANLGLFRRLSFPNTLGRSREHSAVNSGRSGASAPFVRLQSLKSSLNPS